MFVVIGQSMKKVHKEGSFWERGSMLTISMTLWIRNRNLWATNRKKCSVDLLYFSHDNLPKACSSKFPINTCNRLGINWKISRIDPIKSIATSIFLREKISIRRQSRLERWLQVKGVYMDVVQVPSFFSTLSVFTDLHNSNDRWYFKQSHLFIFSNPTVFYQLSQQMMK